MANLQSTCIVGSFIIGTSADTSANGYIWFNSSTGLLEYSKCSGGSIVTCTP
jgi:hypothetical protein